MCVCMRRDSRHEWPQRLLTCVKVVNDNESRVWSFSFLFSLQNSSFGGKMWQINVRRTDMCVCVLCSPGQRSKGQTAAWIMSPWETAWLSHHRSDGARARVRWQTTTTTHVCLFRFYAKLTASYWSCSFTFSIQTWGGLSLQNTLKSNYYKCINKGF